MLATLPLGLWLGVLAWRSGSLWPAVACHTSNNLLATVLARRFGDINQASFFHEPLIVLLLVVAVAGFAASLLLLLRTKVTGRPVN